MKKVIDEDSHSEDVANNSIEFCKDILNRYPELHNFVDDILGEEEDWDKMIAWKRWEKK